jgi:hypothetical protein
MDFYFTSSPSSFLCFQITWKIRTKQNKCVRCIFFANSRETALSYYNLLELLTLDNIYKFRVAAFAHKILIQQTDIPEIFSRYLESVLRGCLCKNRPLEFHFKHDLR